MKQSQRIVKNAVFGIGAAVIGGLLSLATVLTIARSVSVTEFGKYAIVVAFAMFVSNIADSALPRLLIREISKDREQLGPLVGGGASLIWLISGVMCLPAGVVALLIHLVIEMRL